MECSVSVFRSPSLLIRVFLPWGWLRVRMFPRIIAKGAIILFLRRRVAIFRGEGIIGGNTVLQLVCIISGTAFACFVNPCTAVLPSHGQFDQDWFDLQFISSRSRPLNRRKSIILSSAVSKKISYLKYEFSCKNSAHGQYEISAWTQPGRLQHDRQEAVTHLCQVK